MPDKKIITPPKIRLTKDRKVFYNDIDLSEWCTGVKATVDEMTSTVTLTFDGVSFEVEKEYTAVGGSCLSIE